MKPSTYEFIAGSVIEEIDDYIEKMVNDLPDDFKRRKNDELSAVEWAATTIRDRISNHPEKDPYDIIEYFIMEMTHFISLSDDEDSLMIFQTARGTAEDILFIIDTKFYGENQ